LGLIQETRQSVLLDARVVTELAERFVLHSDETRSPTANLNKVLQAVLPGPDAGQVLTIRMRTGWTWGEIGDIGALLHAVRRILLQQSQTVVLSGTRETLLRDAHKAGVLARRWYQLTADV
jgi:hypothetical protein